MSVPVAGLQGLSKKLKVQFFFDYKSPFSYLAKDSVFRLQNNYEIVVQFLPYDFSRLQPDIFRPELRSELAWQKIRYMYTDCRRFASERDPPLIIKGPKKLFDSTCANVGGLFCLTKSPALFKAYTDIVFEKFFKRELAIDDQIEIARVISKCATDSKLDLDIQEYTEYMEEEGKLALYEIEREGDALGIFGVPTLVVEKELYFGNDRIDFVEKHLSRLGLAK